MITRSREYGRLPIFEGIGSNIIQKVDYKRTSQIVSLSFKVIDQLQRHIRVMGKIQRNDFAWYDSLSNLFMQTQCA